jgi:N-acyl-D-aspartate/D-glutamate deacylase
MLGTLEAWRAKGAKIFAQTQVRPLDITMNLGLGTLLLGKTPLWRAFMDQSREGKIAMLSDAANRAVFVSETDEAGGLFGSLVVQHVVSPGNEKYLRRTLNDIAADEGKRLGEVLIDIVLPDALDTEFVLTGLIQADIPKVAALLQHPGMHVGSADAGAHITAFSGAGDTCYLFEKFVRTEKAMSLETAVRRLTSDLARDWRIEGRGEIAVGKYADLVLFDPDTIARGPEQWVDDLPGGGGRYVRGATGISRVIVNGQLLVDGAAYTEATPGMLL